MVVASSTAAASSSDMNADSFSRYDRLREEEEEDDYGLFDLEEDSPTNGTSNGTSTTASPLSSRVVVDAAAFSSPSTAPPTTAVDMHLLARRYQRTDSSSNILLMKRVGSTFFSVAGSVASDLDMMDLSHHGHGGPASVNNRKTGSPFVSAADAPPSTVQVSCSMSDILYHDIMLNIFAHMTATELASFSESAARPNRDVHNYLRLQLERALLLDPISGSSDGGGDGEGNDDDDGDGDEGSDDNSEENENEGESSADNTSRPVASRRSSFLTTTVELGVDSSASPITRRVSFHRQASSSTCPIAVCGAGILSRLATLDRTKAERLVEDYRTISDTAFASTAYKGSHSLLFGTSPALRADAAMRELQARMANHKGRAASCAIVFSVMGAAANKFMTDGGLHMPAEAQQAATAFTLGCAGLGLVATRYGRAEGEGEENDTAASAGDGTQQDAGAAARGCRPC